VGGRVIAIHQPNYLPWLGYFHKMFACDLFIFLDDVQFSRQSYTQRVQVLGPGGPHWLTVPVLHSGRWGQLIVETQCNPTTPWRRKHLGTLKVSYGRHPFFDDVYPVVEAILSSTSDNLAETNIALIQAFAEALGVSCDFARSSSMGVAEADATARLIALLGKVGGTRYVHGWGGLKYQDEEQFRASSIDLIPHVFPAHPYSQKGADVFIAGLSIVDAVCNLGFKGTRDSLLSA
jgi:WbqC-like protein